MVAFLVVAFHPSNTTSPSLVAYPLVVHPLAITCPLAAFPLDPVEVPQAEVFPLAEEAPLVLILPIFNNWSVIGHKCLAI